MDHQINSNIKIFTNMVYDVEHDVNIVSQENYSKGSFNVTRLGKFFMKMMKKKNKNKKNKKIKRAS
ncbi:uncharacterized protein DS421_12g355340 [Arachis hypogaea]|nr:uncharacterized protein DS421_12g355340 [Arachis hypogaea]